MNSAILELWSELEHEPAQNGLVVRRLMPEAGTDLFIGVEQPSGTRLAFLQGERSAFRGCPRELPQSTGLRVSLEEANKSDSTARLMVRLVSPVYRDIFATLVADVFAFAKDTDQYTAVQRFLGRLSRWQRFLAKHGPDGLTIFQQRGLFAELWFLDTYLLASHDPVCAIQAWTGPLAKDQDFQLPTCSIEVKSTTGNPDYHVKVANLRQLDSSETVPLFLLHVALDERQGQGQSLPSLVEKIRASVAEFSTSFEERLQQVGYLDAHAPTYESRGYLVKDHSFYEVAPGFPRILENDLPRGVGAVQYELALSACKDFTASEERATTLIEAKK